MKRFLSLAVALMLLMAPALGLAEAPTADTAPFDPSVFEKESGYSYDKFDKTWSYYKAYAEEYSDATVVLGLQINGDTDGISYPPEMYCWIRDASNSTVLHTIEAIQILIDDTLFSYHKVLDYNTSSSVLLGESSKPLVEAMAAANEISVKLDYGVRSMTLEITGTEYTKNLKVIAQQILDNDIWAHVNPENAEFITMMEELYPLEID